VRVVQVSFFRDPRRRAPGELLRDWPALADVAGAVAAVGLEVHVVQAGARTAEIAHAGATFHFVGERGSRVSGRRPWLTRPSGRLRRRIVTLAPDVLHVHSLGFPLALRLVAGDAACPVLVQDHADAVPRRPLRWLTRAALRRCAGVAFTAGAQAGPWRAARCLPAETPVFEVPESSSHFTRGDRAAARTAANVFGDPAVAWVGRLATVKDPLTALRAFAQAVPDLPDPHLWCCYTEAPLLARIEDVVRRDPRLGRRVHLLGRLPHDRVETLLRACDVYLAASHREGSGFALLEALACGLPAIVTDIPSFRGLTGDGAVARLTAPGDADAMGRALVRWYGDRAPEERAAVRAHFDRHLSFAAVGAGLRAAYERVRGTPCA
jgi:glycosyltransferase involved in cell wall biosynthesis